MSAKEDVGYGRPPTGTRFKPGTSGNPSGRPKRMPKIGDDLQDELEKVCIIAERGASLSMSKRRALVKRLIDTALDGDLRALIAVLEFARSTEKANAASPSELDGMDAPEDDDIVAQFSGAESLKDMDEEPGKK